MLTQRIFAAPAHSNNPWPTPNQVGLMHHLLHKPYPVAFKCYRQYAKRLLSSIGRTVNNRMSQISSPRWCIIQQQCLQPNRTTHFSPDQLTTTQPTRRRHTNRPPQPTASVVDNVWCSDRTHIDCQRPIGRDSTICVCGVCWWCFLSAAIWLPQMSSRP